MEKYVLEGSLIEHTIPLVRGFITVASLRAFTFGACNGNPDSNSQFRGSLYLQTLFSIKKHKKMCLTKSNRCFSHILNT